MIYFASLGTYQNGEAGNSGRTKGQLSPQNIFPLPQRCQLPSGGFPIEPTEMRALMSSKSILIISHPEDVHAHAVVEAVKRKGGTATMWHTADFPTRMTESVYLDDQACRMRIRGPDVDLSDPRVDVIWNRRPAHWVDEDRLHPSDVAYADLTCTYFRKALFDNLCKEAFWVNPPGSESRCTKMTQQIAAAKIGLKIPPTLYSNDPQEIKEFIRRQGRTVVYKSIAPVLPWKGKDKRWQLYTSLLTEEMIGEEDLIKATPSIYQAVVPKAYELRVTAMGHHLFAAKLHSQSTSSGRLDWRKSYHEIKMEPFELSVEMTVLCQRLMSSLNLIFGCFDFAVTPDGDYVFLEINQMGQFLFVERYSSQPLLDAFSEMLLQGRPDFHWRQTDAALSYLDMVDSIEKRFDEACEAHVRPSEEAWDESESENN